MLAAHIVMSEREKLQVPLAFVHHGNQYIITEGYENREGLSEVLGSTRDRTGFAWVLKLHQIYKIPASIHISGTLLEAIAWQQPSFLHELREGYEQGFIELVGSCYGQNLMRFCSYDYNLKQLNEQLALYQIHLGVDPEQVKAFWPPERLWDTEVMAPVLTDLRLLNGGYAHVIVDDRVLLSVDGNRSPRRRYDRDLYWNSELFRTYQIQNGYGLTAVPIAYNLRQSIPPRGPDHWRNIEWQLHCLRASLPRSYGDGLIAVYGDDMEKAAGVGWDRKGPSQFEALLRWVSENLFLRPVKLTEWASTVRGAGTRPIETGTYLELTFHAGEEYEKWYFDPRWDPYRTYFSWSESRVKHLASLDADPALIELAEKQLLASNWETAWHTPTAGAHGDPASEGGPSAWVKALTSHSRHAAVTAEAAFWMKHKDGEAHAYLYDIDGDGEEELILKNEKLFAVFTPRWGGRLVYLFSVDAPPGSMCIGNPCDDWNLMEQLNKYMDAPRNHTGALADVGFEHEPCEPIILVAQGQATHARLRYNRLDSAGHGLAKDIILSSYANKVLTVEYTLPESLPNLSVEFGFSPDYLDLLRNGRSSLKPYRAPGARGWKTKRTIIWIRPENGGHTAWAKPYQKEFGHGCVIRLSSSARRFSLSIGIEIAADLEQADEPCQYGIIPDFRQPAPDPAAKH